MNFPIPLVHAETGEQKSFSDLAAVAAFLKSEGEAAVKWIGWEFARLRPELVEGVSAMLEGRAPAAEAAAEVEPEVIAPEIAPEIMPDDTGPEIE